MVKRVVILFLAIFVTSIQPALANEENPQSYHPEIRIEEVRERLNVSSDQESKFSPVLKEHIKERNDIFEKYGLEKSGASISFRDLRSFRKDMLMLSGKTKEKFSEFLTESQLKEWDVIQEENHSEIRKSFSL